jgi:integral membrane protein (TIGR01906 family)
VTEIKEPSTPAISPFTRRKSRTIASLLSAGVMIVFPFLLLMANVRLVMSPLFLRFEYSRPGFPDDFYGFTQEDRLNYAPYAVNYLLNGEDITFLGDLTFPDGTSLFNIRELRHMRDVKSVTQVVYLVTVVVAVLGVRAMYLLRKFGRLRVTLFRASILTLSLIATIVIAAVMNWNFFFTGFHTLFFEGGTWYFAYSDTLIRLFPEQFWFDAALTIGGFTTFEAVIVILITRFGSFHPSRNSNVDAAHA